MRLCRCAIAAFAFIVTSVAGAQQMPTDVELKAAYCLKVIQTQVDGWERSNVPAPVQDYVSTMLRDMKDRLNRLQVYLTPRMQTLEPTSIRAAMKRAEADMSNYARNMNEVVPACGKDCRMSGSVRGEELDKALQCMTSCEEKDELIARVNSCGKLNWLPF